MHFFCLLFFINVKESLVIQTKHYFITQITSKIYNKKYLICNIKLSFLFPGCLSESGAGWWSGGESPGQLHTQSDTQPRIPFLQSINHDLLARVRVSFTLNQTLNQGYLSYNQSTMICWRKSGSPSHSIRHSTKDTSPSMITWRNSGLDQYFID